jgi:excisionase family DNA binding protein
MARTEEDKNPAQETTAEPENVIGALYNTGQVAQLIGVNVRTVQRMIRNGELAAVGNKRYLRVHAEELSRWKEDELRKARERAEQRRHKVHSE